MAITKYLLPTIALAGSAIGQCSNSATLTITKSADASQIGSCTTYSGSVAIPTDVSDAQDSSGHNGLSIQGVEKIVGNVTVDSAINLASLSFPDLQEVSGLQLGGLTVLSELSLPQIQSIDRINLTALPALQQFSFGNTGVTQSQSILITNTGLTTLKGLDKLDTINSFNVNNNPGLQNVSLGISSIKNAIRIEANNGDQNGTDASFPQLESAMNMTFRNCSSVSLPALTNVSQYLGFYGNSFESFAAPNLSTTGGLVFVENAALSNISIPGLTTINASFQIANNTNLKKIDGIQKLSVVTASFDLSGNFSELDLPNLSQVRGAFNLQTSAEFDCKPFDDARKTKIKGKYQCAGQQSKPGGQGTKPSSTGSGAKPTGAAGFNAVNLPALVGGTSFIAGLLQMAL
ncbi:uncharacterized protein KY384_006946 [Bacidia gigantensis]|uniref:uncharacterized protein n=1 Tax=Bacidia gigantensis TaxID=2732470 RepID=UPI001D059789|nr:uncharacterized protein KY384_006946 [Bacidia gigantensis]KAG8528030.1 hypothetical protein KY384_006946 [Bacidia gigantensis]